MKLTPYTPDMATAAIGSLSGLIITGFPEREYHARPEVSTHDAMKLLTTPAKYRHSKLHPEEPTKAMQLGTALHTLLFEPERWTHRVAVVPADAPKRPTSAQVNAKKPSDDTLAAIDWWANFNHDAFGKIVIDQDTAEEMLARVETIETDPDASKELRDVIAVEVAIFWIDPETGVPRRGRPDQLRAPNTVDDLKSTANASAVAFSNDAQKYGYFIQSADYTDALEILTGEPWRFRWIAAESEAPWLCPVYECPPEGIDLGRKRRVEALTAWKRATESGAWSGYQTGVHQLLPPVWAMREANL